MFSRSFFPGHGSFFPGCRSFFWVASILLITMQAMLECFFLACKLATPLCKHYFVHPELLAIDEFD